MVRLGLVVREGGAMTKLVSFDTETFLNSPGCFVPKGVCGSTYDGQTGTLDLMPDTLKRLEALMQPGTLIAGAFTAYDMAVAGNERPDLLAKIFDHYDRMGFTDILINQALDHVAKGHLFKDPDGKSAMRLADGTVKKRYGLELVMWQRLQRQAKINDEFRKLYGDLSQVPFDQWPEQAKTYPVDDVRETWEIAADQYAKADNMGPLIRVVPSEPSETWQGVTVTWPGTSEPVLLTHPGLNAYAGFALHLLTAWGLRVDADRLRKLKEETDAEHEKEIERFVKTGLLKWDTIDQKYKDNGIELKRRVIRAYNPDRVDVPCSGCAGTGAVPKPKGKGTNQCRACGATGLDVGNAPTTEKGGIKTDRDTCSQSGNEELSDFKASTNKKIRETYIPFLVDGVLYPIHVPSNVVMATCRTSFGKQDNDDDTGSAGLLQTFPRRDGVRDTMRSPPGWCQCSCDWNALEFGNLGQAQKWVTGRSKIVEAINSGKDVHSMLGATILGCTYDEFRARLKDPLTKKFYTMIRQAMKPGNFGYGGRMGAAKFAFTQRKDRIGGHGSMCRLMGRESAAGCGAEKISSWKRRPCDPVCAQCVEVSEEIRLAWLETWELQEYFAWIDSHDNIRDQQAVMVTPGTAYVRGGLNVSAACNQPFQHLGGIGAKLALCLISRECYVDRGTALYGCRPIVLAHDEIITLMPMHKRHAAALRQTELMKLAMKIVCPDVDIGIAPALMFNWWKGAEELYRWDDCKACSGGWILSYYRDGDKMKPARKQCEECQKHGELYPWEPDTREAISVAA